MSRILYALLLVGAGASLSLAQRPMICGPNARMELQCVDACIICDIDGFQGRNDTQGQGDKPPSFCTSINHNIQWIGFLANSPRLRLQLAVSNCAGGNRPDGGLEAGVFEVEGCRVDEAVAVSNCDSDIANNTTQEFVMDNLIPGDYYYFIIDGNNGDVCDYTVTVLEGTTRVPDVPNSGGLNGPTRVCENEPFTYRTNRVTGAPYYDWTLNGDTLGTDADLEQQLSFPTAGIYTLCVTASNICNAGPPECLDIRVGDFAPTTIELTTCADEPVVIAGAPRSQSGTWTEVLPNSVGCDSTVVTNLEVFPLPTAQLDTTICAGTGVRFDGQLRTEAGVYTAVQASAAGCDSTTTLRLSVESCGYDLELTARAVSCYGDRDGVLEVSVTGPGGPYVGFWSSVSDAGFGGSLTLAGDGSATTLSDLPAGTYAVEVTDEYGAQQTALANINEPDELLAAPTLSRVGDYNVSCAGAADGSISLELMGGTAPYTVSWAQGQNTSDVSALTAGTYTATVRDEQGCETEVEATLVEPEPLSLRALPEARGCTEDDPGGVYLDDLGGGHGDYLLTIDGGLAQAPGTYYVLDTGLHELVLEDAVGCSLVRRVLVESTPVPSVATEAQVFVVRGDTTTLRAASSGDIVNIDWTGEGLVGCRACETALVQPDSTTTYAVTVTNRDGCTATAQVVVQVRVLRDVYAPTAISPNGDGRNDGFIVFARDPLAVVEELRVFDRWGNQVFVTVDVPVGAEQLGWQGDHHGELVNPGVFVWWARVRDRDGVVEVAQGDVTVVR